MARTTKSRTLDVWMNGELVGHWTISAQGRNQFNYADTWENSKFVRPVSLSLPLQPSALLHTGEVVENYFDNLLPDNKDIRKRIQNRFASRSIEPFELLKEIGRDCVGAIQLLPAGEIQHDIKTIEGEKLDTAGVAEVLRKTPLMPGLGIKNDDEFRISIAGAQEKTGLLLHKGKWHRPKGATPSTHIFKLPLGKVTNYEIDLSTSVENEWLCLQILNAYGLETAQAEIGIFKEQKALVVERFDRRLSADSSWWMRLPMEDMCQIHGISPGKKYEEEGGPGIEKIMKFLLGSTRSFEDRRAFLKAQILFWMLCATDGHAKNFSIFIEKNGRYRLTPIYDVISAHPILGHGKNLLPKQKAKMAMAVLGKNRHYKWATIMPRHWLTTAKKCGFDSEIKTIMNELVTQTPAVVRDVKSKIPKTFPTAVSTSILSGLSESQLKLKEFLKQGGL
ncbi:MAG: type II toxin-antitoxin system HipA family toxin [Gammaproteobacteria bacterium]|nr:type II toxin-antitoxin system HipA family toxin [Gammaproteobacteria bacterium]